MLIPLGWGNVVQIAPKDKTPNAKIVYDEEANNFYNIIEPHYKCYDKDYEKENPKQHNSRFCKLCKGTGWISWTARNNQLLRYTQCHQCQ